MSIPRVVGNSWTVNGQERVEGSDGSGNEPGEMEVGGGIYESWEGSTTEEKRREEYVIFAKLMDEGDSFG
ncbi:hypothetical protein M9458_051630, partial [Cirrhinus mrigala]